MTAEAARAAGEQESKPAAPKPLVLKFLVGLLGAGMVLQWVVGRDIVFEYALSGANISAGRWITILTHILLHAGVLHLVLNCSALVAFGEVAVRFFGETVRGAAVLVLFFLVCGILGGLTYLAVHPAGTTPVVGASGAISGLIGVNARLPKDGVRMRPINSAEVQNYSIGFVVVNLILAGLLLLIRAGFGVGPLLAWEAHLGGFAAGVLLVGLFSNSRREQAPR